MRRRHIVLLAIAALACASTSHAQHTVRWDGSSGLYPNEDCPFWTLVDNSSASPVLSGGILTLSTNTTGANNLGYSDQAPDIVIPNPLIIEFRARFVSSGTITPARSGMMVQAGVGGQHVTAVVIDADVVKLLSGNLAVGSSASVDTDGGFHTYRIVISGTTVGSPVEVYYDSALILTGAIYLNSNVISSPQILWGEVSSEALGTSEWMSFEHNASNASCVTATAPRTWGMLKTIYR